MRNVLVTGGSRGLGLGIARKLAQCGYRAITVARRETRELKNAIEDAERDHIHFVPFDLAEIPHLHDLVKSLRKEFGPIYGLVNNAGTSFEGALGIMRDAQIEELVRVNVLGPIVLTKYVVRSMMADGGGRIVNIASITAFTGYSGLSVYSSTKASLLGFTRSLAREVGGLGVNVNAVAPGFIDTDLTRGMTGDQRQKVIRRSALQRLAEVDDVANTVEFLLGDRAKNITGTVLTVDAGSTA